MARLRSAVAVLVLLFGAACSRTTKAGPTSTAPTATGSPSIPATTSMAGSADNGTAVTRGPAERRDWDGVRFDVGILNRIDRAEDGRTLVVFDRVQLATPTGKKEGHDLTEEPILYGNTDTSFVNDSPKLRTYVAAPAIEVLRLANLRQTCVDLPRQAPPRWEAVTVGRVVDQSLWRDFTQVSLTFTPDGLVSRLRLSSGC